MAEIFRAMDLICRGAVRKLTQRVVVIEKKLKIMIRFVLRRSKEVNGRLDDLEEIAGKHSRCVSSLARSMNMVTKLFSSMGQRIDRLVEVVKGLEEDMAGKNADYIGASKEIRKLHNKVDALEKLHTTKIAKFIYSPPPIEKDEDGFCVRGCSCNKS
jgi:predicted choloylglycine hydrolase